MSLENAEPAQADETRVPAKIAGKCLDVKIW